MKRKHKQHQDWTDIDEGWLYGEWETGPWWGFHTKEKAYATYGWVSIGSDEVLLTSKFFLSPLTFYRPLYYVTCITDSVRRKSFKMF